MMARSVARMQCMLQVKCLHSLEHSASGVVKALNLQGRISSNPLQAWSAGKLP